MKASGHRFFGMLPARILLLICGISFASAGSRTVDLDSLFGGVQGAFVLYDTLTHEYTRYHPEICATRESPCSTFKIPNSLIALETGVAPDAEFFLPWDSIQVPRQAWWPAAWARGNTLRSAIRHSVVWYYQEIARRIGPERYRASLAAFDYGNQDISSGVDNFWLGRSLMISPDEQVAFLRKWYEGLPGISDRSAAIVRDILLLETASTFALGGKTGTGNLSDGRNIGWFVGFVELKHTVRVFALFLESQKAIMSPSDRTAFAKRILEHLHALQDE